MRKLRKHLKLFVGEVYLFFCSSAIGCCLLDSLDHIKYYFMSDEEKKEFDAKRIQDELICKLCDVSNSLLDEI